MGFLSKIRNNMRKEISRMPRRPGMMRDMGPGNMPRRPDISDIFGRGSFLFGRRPRGNMGSDFRMPQIGGILREGKKRRGGFGFGLGEAIRRLNQQRGGDMGMPRTPQPIPERMPVSNAPSFNPTIFGQPIGDMDFSQMPKISPEDMMNLQVPTDMPMTQDLPEVAPIGMMPQMRMGGMQDMEPRMMMQEGEDVSVERELFSLQSQLKNLEEQLRLDRSYNDDQAVINTSAEMAAIQKRMKEIMEGKPQLKDGGDFPDLTGDGKVTQADILKGRGVYAEGDEVKSFADYQPEGSLKGTFFDYIPDGYQVSSFLMDKFGQEAAQDPTIREMFEKEFKAARMAGKDVFEFMGKPYNTKTLEEVEGMRYGGEMERFQDGGEIDAMLSGMDSEESGAMEDLEQMAPEMEMIDQLVTMVVQMIQQGASEEEVIMFLREQGLDDEDIGTVLQLVAEMAEAEAMPQDGIGAELEQLV